MSFRHAVLALLVGVPVGACGLVASLQTDYADPSGFDGGPTKGSDAGKPSDAGVDVSPDAITLDDAATTGETGSVCAPTSCVRLGFNCGSSIPDGCGGLLSSCGDCPDGSICGGGGGPNKCGAAPCNPTACTSDQCGTVPDGCGTTHSCPTNCSAPMQCKGGGCGGCTKDGVQCKWGNFHWSAWLCDDTGQNRGGNCNRVANGPGKDMAYYCCPPF